MLMRLRMDPDPEFLFRIPELSWKLCFLLPVPESPTSLLFTKKLLRILMFSGSANLVRVYIRGCGSRNPILGLNIFFRILLQDVDIIRILLTGRYLPYHKIIMVMEVLY
jgi:hypothetical protein